MRFLRFGLLFLLLSVQVLAQAGLGEVLQSLQQARQQSAHLDPGVEAFLPRLELLQAMTERLRGGGSNEEWNAYFRFFEVTHQVAQSTPLTGEGRASWGRCQQLVQDLARQRGQSLTVSVPTPGVLNGELLSSAQQELSRLEGQLPVGDSTQFRQARQAMSALKQVLESARRAPDSASSRNRLLEARRRFYLTRGSLGLDPGLFAPLDAVLDQI